MFFLATADPQGWPDCSYNGGLPGFVRVVDEQTLVFPHFDGNGMFRSLGNILENPRVGLLFVDFERPDRLRINGIASLHFEDPLLPEYPCAQLMVRVHAERIFPNCPRYIHKMQLTNTLFMCRPGITILPSRIGNEMKRFAMPCPTINLDRDIFVGALS
jgi:uncharacterized protein